MSVKNEQDYNKLISQKNYLMIENASVDFMIEFDVEFAIFQFIIQTFYKNIFISRKINFKSFSLDIKKRKVFLRKQEEVINRELFGSNKEYNDFMLNWIENALDQKCPLEIIENLILVKEKNNYFLFSKTVNRKKRKRRV